MKKILLNIWFVALVASAVGAALFPSIMVEELFKRWSIGLAIVSIYILLRIAWIRVRKEKKAKKVKKFHTPCEECENMVHWSEEDVFLEDRVPGENSRKAYITCSCCKHQQNHLFKNEEDSKRFDDKRWMHRSSS